MIWIVRQARKNFRDGGKLCGSKDKPLKHERREFSLCWWLVNKPLTTGASVNLFKTAAVCLVFVAMCGCDRGQPTPPIATNVDDMDLPKSADSIGLEFKKIPAGTFMMGDATVVTPPQPVDERATPHEVILTTSFKMGVHEVTQAQYEQVMGVNPSEFKGAANPVEKVSWKDAIEFCRKLSDLPAEKAAGNVYRLPTEAEWEYACRAGTKTKYSFGDDDADLDAYDWFGNNSDGTTHPVGSKQPNPWGLYDMHGNVEEWCQDWYGDYPSGSVTDPTGPPKGDPTGASWGSFRVLRGGAWDYSAEDCPSASRGGSYPSYRSGNFGFRIVLSSSGK